MTFSIVGRCAETGQLGIAISSSSIAVGARCPWLRAGTGAVATQNITLPALGPQILDALEAGLEPAAALDQVVDVSSRSLIRTIARNALAFAAKRPKVIKVGGVPQPFFRSAVCVNRAPSISHACRISSLRDKWNMRLGRIFC